MGDSLTETRGQKRPETDEEMPADKRACSSMEFRPSSSTVSPQMLVNSTGFEAHEGDMETSSSSASASASASGRSEGDGERDSPYGSCDSDEIDEDDDHFSSLREYQRSRSHGDSAKFHGLLSSLSNEAEPSGQLAALTELCELLSFSTEESISSSLADQLASFLVKLAKHEYNPDMMLLAIRALTYLCDVFPHSSSYLVKHDAVPALCQRLMVIEYLDVAEQCLQALEKISRDQPLPCLQSGAIMAVLGYIDFFSTTVQRSALRTVVNTCKKLPSGCPSTVMEAIPRLCNLLQYEDQQLVELVATCLIKIADHVKASPEMLSELYGHGLIGQVVHLIDLNNRITLSQPTYTGLVGVVAKIASGSADAVRTLYELNIGSILKDALCNSDLSRGILPPRNSVDKNCNQVHEILTLLHELLPEVPKDRKEELLSTKENILLGQPDKLLKFGMDILPTLMQVVSSGANLNVCYGCLSVISRIVYFSSSETLLEMFKAVNIASFLAGVFTRNDLHILSLALQIAQASLDKLSNVLMQAFVKEGVLFAIDALLMPENCSQLSFPAVSCTQSKRNTGKDVRKCLCYVYRSCQPVSTSDSEICKADKDSVVNLAEHIKTKYFSVELQSSHSMVTDVLQALRTAAATITDLLNINPSREAGSQNEEKLCSILHKVILQLSGNEPISTFELIESGIMKALLNYLSNGRYLNGSFIPDDDVSHAYDVQKRFETFARISLSSPDPGTKDLPLSFLVGKLQSALSTVENFHAIMGYVTRQRGYYATVPRGQSTIYPSVKVRFVRGEEELCLNDFSAGAVTVDPFCLVDEVEQYLLPKVIQKKMESSEGSPQVSVEDKSMCHMGSGSLSAVSPDMQEGDGKLHCTPMETSDMGQTTADGTKVITEPQSGSAISSTCNEEGSKKGQLQASFSIEDVPSKLILYLDGEALESSCSLYQQILQRRVKSQHELQNVAKLWSNTYTITYKRVTKTESSGDKEPNNLHDSGTIDNVFLWQHGMPLFCRTFFHRLGSAVDTSSPTADILYLLRSFEMMNRYAYQLVIYERMNAFAEGKIDDFNNLKVGVSTLSQHEFVSSRLSEKLEQQLGDSSVVHVGAMPLWCSQLMASCPFLFSFEARCKYFRLAAFGKSQGLPDVPSHNDSDISRDRRGTGGSSPRKKFLVCRDRILESAAQMMDLYARKKVIIEVEYSEEVGTGLGPTLEYYTLVSHEFQKAGLGMWRGGYMSPTNSCGQQGSSAGFVVSTSGLFPRPWSPTSSNINGLYFSDVIKKYFLLGQFVGKALQDGRFLDIPFSKAFYKLILGKELSLCDIQSFDPELGRILLEFQALVNRQNRVQLACGEDVTHSGISDFRSVKIEDLSLDFTLPGYPDYILAPGMDDVMVTISNLKEYISLVLDATLHTGIARQVEAFMSGLNQVLSNKHLRLFSEDELELLLCGERDSWVTTDLLDHIKFDHGYTSGSPPIINLLEVISEFDYEQRRAFLQFVTGTPRLPPGGLSALNPKLTIVRKHSSNLVDADLPSVMTCANYLKLPPYSSKETMKEKLLYAITEGQGSFHLS